MSTVSRELKAIFESLIDDLTTRVSVGDTSVADALAALRAQAEEVPGIVYSLSKKYLKRVFGVIGHANDLPTLDSSAGVKSAREMLVNYLAGESRVPVSSSGGASDGQGDDHDGMDGQSGVSSESDRVSIDDSDIEVKESGIRIRESPRKVVKKGRADRALFTESNRLRELEQKLEKNEEIIRNLQKRDEVRERDERQALSEALKKVPSIGDKLGGKSSKNAKKKGDGPKKSKQVSYSIHKDKYFAPADALEPASLSSSSDSDSSSSSSSSNSSSSSSSSSSSDDSKRRHRSKHSKRSKRHKHRDYGDGDDTRRHARSFLRNVGKDGVLAYLNRITAKVIAEQTKTDMRSIHEAECIANALDALIRDKIPVSCDGIEVLATRLIGLIYAIQTNDWTVMSAIEYKVVGTNTLPLSSQLMAKLVKRGARIKALTSASNSNINTSNSGSKAQSGTYSTGYGRNKASYDTPSAGYAPGVPKKNNSYFSNSGALSGGAATGNKSSNAGTTFDKGGSKPQ